MTLEEAKADLEVISILLKSMKENLHFHHSLDGQIDTIIQKANLLSNSIVPLLSHPAPEPTPVKTEETKEEEKGLDDDAKKLLESLKT